MTISMKQVIAVSKETYRKVLIWETNDGGFSIIIGEKIYPFITLEETTAFIDTLYATIVSGPGMQPAN